MTTRRVDILFGAKNEATGVMARLRSEYKSLIGAGNEKRTGIAIFDEGNLIRTFALAGKLTGAVTAINAVGSLLKGNFEDAANALERMPFGTGNLFREIRALSGVDQRRERVEAIGAVVQSGGTAVEQSVRAANELAREFAKQAGVDRDRAFIAMLPKADQATATIERGFARFVTELDQAFAEAIKKTISPLGEELKKTQEALKPLRSENERLANELRSLNNDPRKRTADVLLEQQRNRNRIDERLGSLSRDIAPLEVTESQLNESIRQVRERSNAARLDALAAARESAAVARSRALLDKRSDARIKALNKEEEVLRRQAASRSGGAPPLLEARFLTSFPGLDASRREETRQIEIEKRMLANAEEQKRIQEEQLQALKKIASGGLITVQTVPLP